MTDLISIANAIHTMREGEKKLREDRLQLEAQLQNEMATNGASMLDHPTLTVEMKKGKATYDISKAWQLKELIPADEWEKVYMPEETGVIKPERLDGRRMKALAKFGGEIPNVIEGLTLREPPRLSIKEKS
jgi:hypothetical protein